MTRKDNILSLDSTMEFIFYIRKQWKHIQMATPVLVRRNQPAHPLVE